MVVNSDTNIYCMLSIAFLAYGAYNYNHSTRDFVFTVGVVGVFIYWVLSSFEEEWLWVKIIHLFIFIPLKREGSSTFWHPVSKLSKRISRLMKSGQY